MKKSLDDVLVTNKKKSADWIMEFFGTVEGTPWRRVSHFLTYHRWTRVNNSRPNERQSKIPTHQKLVGGKKRKKKGDGRSSGGGLLPERRRDTKRRAGAAEFGQETWPEWEKRQQKETSPTRRSQEKLPIPTPPPTPPPTLLLAERSRKRETRGSEINTELSEREQVGGDWWGDAVGWCTRQRRY